MLFLASLRSNNLSILMGAKPPFAQIFCGGPALRACPAKYSVAGSQAWPPLAPRGGKASLSLPLRQLGFRWRIANLNANQKLSCKIWVGLGVFWANMFVLEITVAQKCARWRNWELVVDQSKRKIFEKSFKNQKFLQILRVNFLRVQFLL